jgi:hypothetical protein
MAANPLHSGTPAAVEAALKSEAANQHTMGSSLSTEHSEPQGPFYPGPADIFVVRAMLNKAFQLPPDVVDTVFDYAEYWARSSNEIDYNVEHKSPLRITGNSRMENRFLVSSAPLARAVAASPALTRESPH